MQLQLQNIKKAFDKKTVLSDATFTFEKGKIYGLLGRNGAGKTTLFNCISSEFKFDSGSISLFDDNLTTQPLDYTKIGYVFSEPVLPDFLTGYEFIKFFMDINSHLIEGENNIDYYFDIIKINEEDRYKLIREYSHGMKNKIQMLCFLITRPPIILLDEPLTSFDVIVALEIKKLLKEIKSKHIIIFSTHILQLATDLCDEIVILNNGELELLNHDLLHSPDFEENIMNILKED